MTKRKRLKTIICVLVILIALTGVALLLWQYWLHIKEQRQIDKQQSLYVSAAPTDSGGYLADALAINSDTVAWLTIPDTVIDFPIVQCDDNEYYLHHGFDKSEYSWGCPFLDYRCSGDFSDFNSIIYGHHIRNGQVFSGLVDFQSQSYLDAHPTGTLTLPDEICTITFIACVNVKSDSFLYSVVHPGRSDRKLYLQTIKEQALSKIDFKPSKLADERLVVLSTCSYEFSEARTALVGLIE